MFKIINSREYREMCERVAFLESALNDKDREIEVRDETIKTLKKQIVGLDEHAEQLKSSLRHAEELRDNALKEVDRLNDEVNRLKSKPAKPEPISFEEKATAKRPRPARKPAPKKENK